MPSLALSLPAFRLRLPERRHWLSAAVLAVAASLYLFAGQSLATMEPVTGAANANTPSLSAAELARLAPPLPEPLQFRPIPPQDAEAINAAIPVSNLANPSARPFKLAFSSEADRARSLECLTAAVYYEAAIEPTEGQRAVAQVVLNRVRHPAYPRSVCGVVFQGSERTTGCQFTFTCDGSLRRTPSAAGWTRAKKVAEEALDGNVYAPVGLATHYHTNWVVPYWSSSLVKAANVGTHIFYRWAGGWGRPPAFARSPLTTDPGMAAMRARAAALALSTDAKAIDDAAALAALAADPDRVVTTASVDSFQRAVLRRYEPLTREAATEKAIARTGEPASASLRWALGGERAAGPATPLGARTQAATPPAPPRCLEGVRRLPDGAQGPAQPQSC
jgi:spore germination cell wall hydrolase CwlJ-like protein